MPTSTPAEITANLHSLQAQLYARQSILHFAHAAVSTLLALTAAGAAAKMHWDYTLEELPWTMGVIALATGLFVYGATRYVLGRRQLERELMLYAQLTTLRKGLGLDDPAHLQP